jgi:microcystin-dependent protein
MKPIYIFIIAILFVVIVIIITQSKEKFTNVSAICQNTGRSGCIPSVNNDTTITTSFEETTNSLAINIETGDLSSSTILPVGGIIMWAGTVAPPSGWAICDGSLVVAGNTQIKVPDLRGRFVIGATTTYKPPVVSAGLSTYSVGDYGGEEVHTLTLGEMPEHSHKYNGGPLEGGDGIGNDWLVGTKNSSVEGGSQPHNNLPPFYALVYIMRVF